MPRTSPTRSAFTKARAQYADPRRLTTYNPKVASRGLTLTTPWGPVDLVAIERTVRGHSVPLDPADEAWLRNRTCSSYGRRVAAELLGIDRARFNLLLRRWRAAHPTTETEA